VCPTKTCFSYRCDSVQSDWEASTDEEKDKPAPVAATAPPKKKGTIKQKIAEKEAERQARLAAGDDEVEYDEDAVLDPRAKAQLEKQRELESDLTNATELFVSATVKGACVKRLYSLVCSKPEPCALRLVRRGSRQDLEIYSQV
jgi:translation initiation factor 3 subunit J